MAEVLRQCGSRPGLLAATNGPCRCVDCVDLSASGFAQSGKSFKRSSGCSRNSIRDPTTPNPSAGARGAREPTHRRSWALPKRVQAALMRVCREDPGLWAPATLKLIFPPAAQTPPSQIYAARIESVKRLRLCLTPWPWRVRCASCMYGVHVVRHPGSTAVVSSSSGSSMTGAALVTTYRTIAIPQTNTNETNACTSPASPAFFPFDGLSDATRRPHNSPQCS